MTSQKDEKPTRSTGSEASSESLDPFKLEDMFEDATQIFKPNKVLAASSTETIIAVDTNVLLLPYTIRKDSLGKLLEFYQKLRAAGRLYLPSRAAREFIVHRDRKLAELLKIITDVRSRINIGETKLSPILEGVEGSDAMAAASKALTEAKSQYTKALALVEGKVQSWSGDDPVTSIYNTVFDEKNIVSPPETNQALLVEWESRQRRKIPPGYKDANKTDGGIGDFLIWKTLLNLGERLNRDLIFVTGEEKADWFVRSNGSGAYPRPELVAEYRKHSGGKGLRLVEFNDVLREMDVAQEFVLEVERAELTANNLIRGMVRSEQSRLAKEVTITPNTLGTATFRTKYGGDTLVFNANGVRFVFAVSEATRDAIYVYPNGSDELFPIATGTIGDPIILEGRRAITDAAFIRRGQLACFRSSAGFKLVFRLLSASLPSLNEEFEINVAFAIFGPTETAVVP